METTKEKLFKLVNACIEDRNFYHAGYLNAVEMPNHFRANYYNLTPTSIPDKKITLSHKETHTVSYAYISQDPINYQSTSIDSKFRTAINEKKQELNLEQYDEHISVGKFTIDFADQPSIKIFVESSYEQEILERFNLKNYILVDGSPKIFGIELKFIKSSSYEHKVKKVGSSEEFVLKKQKYKNTFYLTSGMLSVEITPEECNAFWHKIEQNYQKFLIQNDEEKLDDRLKEYSK